MTKTGRSHGLAVIAVAGAVFAACGGGGGKKSAAQTTTTALAASSANSSVPSGPSSAAATTPTTRTVGKTGWFGGFAITVDTATLTPGFGSSASLELGLTYENLTDQTAQAPRSGHVILGGASLDALVDSVDVPGKGKAKGTIKTGVDTSSGTPDAVLDGITLVYGEAADNQTTIPLAAKAAVQSVEPKSVAVTGQLKQKQIIIDLVNGSTAPSYVAGEKGKGILAIQVKISCTADCQANGYAIGRESFSVKTPDGQSLTAADSSPFCCEALYPGRVFEGPKETVHFKVPLPVQGAFAVTFADQSLVNQGSPGSSTVVTVV